MSLGTTFDSILYAYLKDNFKEAANILKTKYKISDPPNGSPKLENIVNKYMIKSVAETKLDGSINQTNAKKKKPNESSSDSESDSSEDEKKLIVKKTAPKPVTKALAKQKSSSDSSSEEDAPKQQVKPLTNSLTKPIPKPGMKTALKQNAKQESSSDDESPQQSRQSKTPVSQYKTTLKPGPKVVAKLIPKQDSSSVSDSSSDEESKKFRKQFDYVLNNLQKIKDSEASEKLELFDWNSYSNAYDSDMNNEKSGAISLDADEDTDEDNVNEIEIKRRGEKDIQRDISEQHLETIKESLKTIKWFKDISFEQIVYLIQSFEPVLKQIIRDENNRSFFAQINQSYGYPGITSNIQLWLFSKSLKSYIMGCLCGLFPGNHHKVFGVLFPETLVRIAMKVKGIDYNTALNLLKPSYD